MIQDFKTMKYIIEHNTQNYVIGRVDLWKNKLLKRTIHQRKSLSFLLFFTQIVLFYFFKELGLLFTLSIIIILLTDLIMTMRIAIQEKKNTESYILMGGENIEIVVNDNYIALMQDDTPFHLTKWDEVSEVYLLKDPDMISFKNRNTNHLFILFGNEIKENFEGLKKQIILNIKVIPLKLSW